ncbi:hypothetical protein [Pyxidicoccus sp. MSG2]|uniref:hypothetical protein n=1 Tax=Pyxidicoccus sp. MSG2 TaxID=2996790 RepID=UPI002271238D|nr:hypothetical protein [Pyxidicoccus sp. MSG2]MCY1017006.1 hypothetical protein [Pyxidicoccus sp. MSG2]
MRGSAPEAATAPPVAAEARAPAELERELRALRAELESLRQGQGRLTRQVESAAVPAPVAAAPAGTEAPPTGARSAEEERAAAEEARKERLMELDARLEAAVQTEARDTTWAGPTEDKLSGAFHAPELVGSHLTRVDCRTKLCVLEVEHDTPEARAELLMSLQRSAGIRGAQAVIRPAGDGTRLASRVYLSRPGERLPMKSHP